jgi:hypothetical protein
MATKSVCFMINAHTDLTKAIADALTDAINGGLSKEDAVAVLSRFVELLEKEE